MCAGNNPSSSAARWELDRRTSGVSGSASLAHTVESTRSCVHKTTQKVRTDAWGCPLTTSRTCQGTCRTCQGTRICAHVCVHVHTHTHIILHYTPTQRWKATPWRSFSSPFWQQPLNNRNAIFRASFSYSLHKLFPSFWNLFFRKLTAFSLLTTLCRYWMGLWIRTHTISQLSRHQLSTPRQFNEILNHHGNKTWACLGYLGWVNWDGKTHSKTWAAPFHGLGAWTEWKRESEQSTSIHPSLLPDSGCHTTSCPMRLPFRPWWTISFPNASPNKK